MRSILALIALVVCFAMPAKADDWSAFKTAHLGLDGSVMDDSTQIIHSEGQSYAMLLAVRNGDRPAFDLAWNFAKRKLRRPDRLFSWKLENGQVADDNNASDAEIVMAWSLIEAGRSWDGGYMAEASELVALIRAKLIVPVADPANPSATLLLVLPGVNGFQSEDGAITLNPSYWVFPAFDAFARIDDPVFWGDVSRSGERIVALASARGFTPNWLSFPSMKPAAGLSSRSSYDALRVPLWMAWSGRSSPTFTAWRQLWRDRQAAWIDSSTGEVATFGPGPEQLSVLALLDRVASAPGSGLSAMPITGLRTPYYASAITQLVRMAWKERFAE